MIMDYEKAYKEAIKRAKAIIKVAEKEEVYKSAITIFPELNESRDERIREALINGFKDYKGWDEEWFDGITVREAIDWLEKQGEQSPSNNSKPKFKVGDWCIDNEDGTIFQIMKVLDNTYTYKTNEGKEYSCTHYSLENDARFWTIQDAKDGDILVTKKDERPFIFKGLLDPHHPNCPVAYCGIDDESTFISSSGVGWWTDDNISPAIKEQREALMKAMADAGYTFDFEKKELNEIHVIDEGKAEIDYCFTKMMNGEKVSSAWGEEDKEFLRRAIKAAKGVYPMTANWLKSLKNRITNEN